MKRYIIDYKTPAGFENFVVVEAATEADAVRIFHGAGVDGWTGYNYAEYEVTAVSER